jgi:CBS domain-containing protein
MEPMETVRSAMLRHPTVHAPDLTVGEAQAVFAARQKTHLLVLVEHGVLVSTVVRDDVEGRTDPATPARDVGTLAGRTVPADLPLGELQEQMVTTGLRRLAVVDDDRRLLGLLCLKRSRTGFCTDEGVAAMRAERAATARSTP